MSGSRSSLAVPASPFASGLKMPSGRSWAGLSAGFPGFGMRQRSARVRPSDGGDMPGELTGIKLRQGMSGTQFLQHAEGA